MLQQISAGKSFHRRRVSVFHKSLNDRSDVLALIYAGDDSMKNGALVSTSPLVLVIVKLLTRLFFNQMIPAEFIKKYDLQLFCGMF